MKQYRLLAHCSRDGRYLVVAEVHDNEILGLEQLLWNLAEVIVAHVLMGGGWRVGEGGRGIFGETVILPRKMVHCVCGSHSLECGALSV